MIDFLQEEATIVYILNIVASAMGTTFFVIHWKKLGTVTNVFAFITFWLFGHLLEQSVELYARWVYHFHDIVYIDENVLHSWWWPKRLYVETLAILLLVATVVKRKFLTKIKYVDCRCKLCPNAAICELFQAVLKCDGNGSNENQ